MSDFPPVHLPELLAHRDFLRRLARALLGDPAGAEDVVQEAMMRALRHPEPARSRGWLATVTRRLALQRVRNESRRRAHEARQAEPGPQGSSSEDPAARAVQAETIEQLTAAVTGLREPYRRTLLARFYEDLSLTQLAQREGVAVQTVHSRVRRGLDLLRESLDRRAPGGRQAWQLGLIGLVRLPPEAALGAGLASTLLPTTIMASSTKTLLLTACLLILAAMAYFGAFDDTSAQLDGGRSPDGSQPVDLLATGREAPAARPARERLETSRPLEASTPGEAPDELALAGLRLQVVYAEPADTPAAGRSLKVMPWDARRPFAATRELRSDAQGWVDVDGLPPGRVMIYCDIGGGGSLVLQPGETQEHRIVIPAGIDIEGLVRAGSGAPVPGAQIWMSDYGNDAEGRVVAVTDLQGRFRIRQVSPQRYLAARARGYGPSRMQLIRGAAGETCKFEFELPSSQTGLSGSVRDPLGQAVAELEIRVAQPRFGFRKDAQGRSQHGLAPRLVRTDADGRFVCSGLEPGKTIVTLRPAGFAPQRHEVTLEAGKDRALHLQLGLAASLTGTVRDEAGAPVPAAVLRVGEYASHLGFYQRCDAQGRFRVEGLPPGAQVLHVEKDGVGKTQAQLQLRAGEVHELDPVLHPGRVLHGLIVDGQGQPRSGWHFYLSSETRGEVGARIWSESQRSGEDGSFRFLGCPPGSFGLEVSEPGSSLAPLRHLRGLEPSAEALRIVVRDDELPRASVRGHILGGDGRPQRGTIWVTPKGQRSSRRTQLDAEGGFQFAKLSAGEYRLRFAPPRGSGLRLPAFRLQVEEQLDLGRIDLPAPGILRVRVLASAGTGTFAKLRVQPDRKANRGLRIGPDPLSREIAPEAAGRLELVPGWYLVQGLGEGLAARAQRVEVRAGETTELELQPESSVPVRLRVQAPAGAVDVPLILTCYDAQGFSICSRLLRSAVAGNELGLPLGPGRYTIRVRQVVRGNLPVTQQPRQRLRGDLELKIGDAAPATPPLLKLRLE